MKGWINTYTPLYPLENGEKGEFSFRAKAVMGYHAYKLSLNMESDPINVTQVILGGGCSYPVLMTVSEFKKVFEEAYNEN